MKRFLRTAALTLMLVIQMVSTPASAEMSVEAKRFQTNLVQFLREEGYFPTVDDNTVNFKKEGRKFWISLYGSVPVKVTFHIAGFGIEDANYLALMWACNKVNRELYYVKAFVTEFSDDGDLSIAIEMPCHSAEEFRYTFHNCLDVLEQAREMAQEAYSDFDSTDISEKPFTIESVQVANVKKDNTIINDYGNTIYSSRTRYLKPKLEIKSSKPGTYKIYIKLYNPDGSLSTGNGSPDGYSTSTDVEVKSGTYYYPLTGWGADSDGHWPAGQYRFEFWYDGSKVGEKTFRVN